MSDGKHRRDSPGGRQTLSGLSGRGKGFWSGDGSWITEQADVDWVEEEQGPPRPWGLGAVLAGIVVALASVGVGVVVLALLVGEERADSAVTFNVGLAILAVVIMAVAWGFGPGMHGGGMRSLGLRLPESASGARWLLPLGVFAAILLFNGVYTEVVTYLDIEILTPSELPFSGYGPIAMAFTGVLVALVGPFAEEVFFRGFVQSGLVHRWGPVVGVLVSAGVFSIAHASVAIIIPIFVAGALLGWLYWRTGSLWSCVWVHGAQNGVAFLGTLLAA